MSLLSPLRRRGKPLHVDPAPHTRQRFDNILVTANGDVMAGFRMGGVRWDYVAMEARRQTLDAVQDGWATLVGLDYHERVTTRPMPAAEWAARLDARTPTPLPDVHLCDQSRFTREQLSLGKCGCETWNRYLARAQRVIGAHGMDDRIVYRYFVVGNVGSRNMLAEVRRFRDDGVPPSEEVKAALAKAKQVRDAVTGPGWLGKPMTPAEQRWLRSRSLAPGVPVGNTLAGLSSEWLAEGDAPFESLDVRHNETQWDRSVEVVAWRDGRQITRRVQVLTLAREAHTLNYPENGLEPWMVFAERVQDSEGYGFGVEWSTCGRIASGAELKAQAELDLRKAIHLQRDYVAFNEPPREESGRGIARAKVVRDQVSNGEDRTAARFVGSVDLMVWGEDVLDSDGRVVKTAEEVVEERGEAVRKLYAGNQLGFHFVVPMAQSHRLAMATPGEYPIWDRSGYQRQWPLDFHATELPNVSAAVGDDNGPYMGPTMGAGRRPTFHDPHFATEGRTTGRGQNIWIFVTTLGGGKTTAAIGRIGYDAVRRGIRTIVRDPSGPSLAMCGLPELAPYAVGFNLLEGEDGILNPPSLLRDPVREEFAETRQWRRAIELAKGERGDLMQDIARRTLPHDLYGNRSTLDVLREAARAVEWTRERTMWDLVEQLEALRDDHAKRVAYALRDAADRPRLSLLFAPRGEGGDFVRSHLKKAVLTVVATPGIKRAPDSVGRGDWNHEERAADPIIYLSSLYTGRLVYDKPMKDRALFIADEAEDMTDGGVGRAWLSRFGRDHSKHNIAGYLLLKNLNDAVMSKEVMNFVAGAWLGRMATLAPAEEVLSRLGVVDKAYARSLLRLSEREAGQFLHIDAFGRAGGMRFDLDYTPWIKDAIFTDPGTETSDQWIQPEGL